MLNLIRYWFDQLKYEPSQAKELLSLRQHITKCKKETFDTQEQILAKEMLQLRREITTLLNEQPNTACSTCAKRHPLPTSLWNGGLCCSGKTANLFSDDEVASLVASKIRKIVLTPPSNKQAGCLFRGATGCSLSPDFRPNICIYYMCRDLSKELSLNNRFKTIHQKGEQLQKKFQEFQETRKTRQDQIELLKWEKEIERLLKKKK